MKSCERTTGNGDGDDVRYNPCRRDIAKPVHSHRLVSTLIPRQTENVQQNMPKKSPKKTQTNRNCMQRIYGVAQEKNVEFYALPSTKDNGSTTGLCLNNVLSVYLTLYAFGLCWAKIFAKFSPTLSANFSTK